MHCRFRYVCTIWLRFVPDCRFRPGFVVETNEPQVENQNWSVSSKVSRIRAPKRPAPQWLCDTWHGRRREGSRARRDGTSCVAGNRGAQTAKEKEPETKLPVKNCCTIVDMFSYFQQLCSMKSGSTPPVPPEGLALVSSFHP